MKRVKTGVRGLDEMLNGGFLSRTANLFEGAPGTGKTTLGMQFIYNGIVHYNEPGIILTFEEFPQQYYRDAMTFNWDLSRLEKQNKLRIVMTSPEISRLDLQMVKGRISRMIAEIGAQRMLVDSLSYFERITPDPVELRQTIYNFVNSLKGMGLTLFLTRESPALLGETPGLKEDWAFAVDSYSLLRYVEINSIVHKAILILKLRGSDHAKDIRQFEITPNGVQVRSKFKGQAGIMSGAPRPKPEDAFMEAFGTQRMKG